METFILGIGHRMRQGKDLAAQAILDARGAEYDIVRRAFADSLKEEVHAAAEKAGGMLGLFTKMAHTLPAWVVYDPNAPMDDPLCPFGKQRNLLQWWGSDFRRAQDSYYWVKKHILWLKDHPCRVCISPDMRFWNEFYYAESKGTTIKVTAEGCPVPVDEHISEHELDTAKFSYEINCLYGDTDELRRDAVTVFDMIVESMNPKEFEA